MSHPLLTAAQVKMNEAVHHFDHELSGVRTGRAHPGLVENVFVNSYGTKAPLKTLATITIPDKSTIAIQPWDRSIVNSIEKALIESNLGAQPISDGHIIRVSLPATTEEQRLDLGKKIREMAENTKVSVRSIRSDTHSGLRKMREKSEITEDDFYQYDKELQHIVNATNKSIDDHAVKKEQEIMTI